MAAGQVSRAPRLTSLGAVLLLAGCVTQPPPTLYAWGSYEDAIYVAAVKPGSMLPEEQLQLFEKDRQASRAANHRLPPGWHGQMAYLYAATGRIDLAQEELVAEKTAFPESTVFCDNLLKNLGRKTEQKP